MWHAVLWHCGQLALNQRVLYAVLCCVCFSEGCFALYAVLCCVFFLRDVLRTFFLCSDGRKTPFQLKCGTRCPVYIEVSVFKTHTHLFIYIYTNYIYI